MIAKKTTAKRGTEPQQTLAEPKRSHHLLTTTRSHTLPTRTRARTRSRATGNARLLVLETADHLVCLELPEPLSFQCSLESLVHLL